MPGSGSGITFTTDYGQLTTDKPIPIHSKLSDTEYSNAKQVFNNNGIEEVVTFIDKISDICRKGIFLSVPKSEWILFRADVRLPLIGRKQLELTLPRKKILEPNHFWEIGKAGTTLKELDAAFAESGFMLKERFKRFSRYFMMYASKR